MIRPLTLFVLLSLEVSIPWYGQEMVTWIDTKGFMHFAQHSIKSNSTQNLLSNQKPVLSQINNDKEKPSKFDNRSKNRPVLSINIISPTNGETVRDNTGSISIEIELNRDLKTPEQLQLLMDNQPVGALSTKKVWQLENIDRGTHSFSIQLVVSGKVIASSSSVTIYLHRASVN